MQAVSMKFKPAVLAAALLSGTLSLNVQAALTSYTNEGVDLVYSSVSDVTWTKDANLFKTMYDADKRLISKIAAVTFWIYDPYYGLQTISDSSVKSGDYDDFDTSSGRVTWWGALAFVNYLNHIGYAGTRWFLPFGNSGVGYNPPTNGTAPGSELVELYYQELGSKAFPTAGFGIKDPSNIFHNEGPFYYWSGSTRRSTSLDAWGFDFGNGYQGYADKSRQYYAWAVSLGMISSIPEADTTAMLLAGLGVMGAVLRRRA